MRLSWIKIVSFSLSLFVFSGCTPAVNTQQLQTGVSQKDFVDKTILDMEKDTSSQSEMWYWLNLGRLYQTKHNYEKSIGAFDKAEAILNEYEGRAEVSMRNVGSGAGSLLFSKGAETYYGKGYERTLMHTLNGMNYAMLGNFEGATVEMRKMEKRQEFWLKESEEKLAEAKEKSAEKGNPNTEQVPAGYSMGEMLQDEEVRKMANNYQDAFSYALSAIMSKLSNDEQYSEISQKRAMALSSETQALFAPAKKKATPEEVDVYVVLLTGQAPTQTIDKIRFPLLNLRSYVVLDLPSLNKPREDVSTVTLSTPVTGNVVPPRLLKTDKMAYKTLKDELPLEIMKSLVRATTKGVIANQVGNKGGAIAGLATSLVMDVSASAMEKSYRNWELLPNSGYLSKISAKRGDTVAIRLDGRETVVQIPLETKKGSLILVSHLSSNNVEVDHVEY